MISFRSISCNLLVAAMLSFALPGYADESPQAVNVSEIELRDYGVEKSIVGVPDWIKRLTNLRDLKVSTVYFNSNDLDLISYFPRLRSVEIENIWSDRLVNFSSDTLIELSIVNSAKLKSISGCDLKGAISVRVESNKNLAVLDCLQSLDGVEMLVLSDNNLDNGLFDNLPMGALSRLEKLDLSGNPRISELSDSLSNSRLEELDLSGTAIQKVPGFVSNLVNLRVLNLSDTCIPKNNFEVFYEVFSESGIIKNLVPSPKDFTRGAHCK